VVVVQSVRRRKVALRLARNEFRRLFDSNIARALAEKDPRLSDRLAKQFAFFGGFDVAVFDSDVKRLLLVAALFRDRNDAPFCLVRVLSLLARVEMPLSVAGSACKLVLCCFSGATAGQVARQIQADEFFGNLGKCLVLYPSLHSLLVAVGVASVRAQRSFRSLFVRHVMGFPNVLAKLPPGMLPGVVQAIGPVDEELSSEKALAVVGNLAFLVSNNVLNDLVISTLGSVLYKVVPLIFPQKLRDPNLMDDDSDEDEEEPDGSARCAPSAALVRDQLKLLSSPKTVRDLFAAHDNLPANMSGLCLVYATLLEFAPLEDRDRIRNLAFHSPDVLVSLVSLLFGDDASVHAFVSGGSPQPAPWWLAVLRVFCEVQCRFASSLLIKARSFFFFCFLACKGFLLFRQTRLFLLVL
jgi:hypothetical protein